METKTEEPKINWTADFTISEPLHDAASAISGAYTRMAINFPQYPPDLLLDELAIKWHMYYKQIGELKFNSGEEGEEEINIIGEICKDVLRREKELIKNHNSKAIKNLQETELFTIYNEKIKQIFFHEVLTSENKTAVFVGGQPGSGKSHLNYLTIEGLDNQSAVIIDSNLLRENHPYSGLAEGMEVYELDEQCSVWGEMILQDAMKGNKNIVFNGTLGRNSTRITGIMKRLKENGYKIKVNVLAINDAFSKIGYTWRYENQISKWGRGRNVDSDYHDHTYRYLDQTLEILISGKYIDELRIYSRDHTTKEIFVKQGHTYDAEIR